MRGFFSFNFYGSFFIFRTPPPEEEIKQQVEQFIELLTNAIGEKVFITDYHRFYPVDVDIDILSLIHPGLDIIKRDYILSSVISSLDTLNLQPKTTEDVSR